MFELGTFIVSIITFLIMFWIIARYGFKPLAVMLEKRRVHVETQITEAEQSRQQAEAFLSEQRQLLDEARHQAKAILDEARLQADQQGRELVAQAQEEARRLLEENRAMIERERADMLSGVMASVSSLSVELSEKLLRRHLSHEVHEEMIKEAEKILGELVC
ncbi:MAG: F0F1 ATP synthase subunit B [Firmicutes bacterium]|nr:F0F1 ATP synthase subunit B [Bacillota bacterium]